MPVSAVEFTKRGMLLGAALACCMLGAEPLALAASERVVYAFAGAPDGANPFSNLLNVFDTLYGTTANGGINDGGTVFSITTAGGSDVVIHSFASVASSFEPRDDGVQPFAGLTQLGNSLFGTTQLGGTYGLGTIFKVNASGKEKVIHSFSAGSDGASPFNPLIAVHGILYATTQSGGKFSALCCDTIYGGGTFFSLNAEGTEVLRYSFGGSATDAQVPYSPLTFLNGNFYGVSQAGGDFFNGSNYYGGTVFTITPSGSDKILHSFGGPGDGSLPRGRLIYVKGVFYATTSGDGGNCTVPGTVFAMTPEGSETILHAFTGGADGAFPEYGGYWSSVAICTEPLRKVAPVAWERCSGSGQRGQ